MWLTNRNNLTRSSATAESAARPILVPIESSCDFLTLINTNLPPIIQRFQVMDDFWSKFRWRHGSAHFNALAG